MSKATGVNKWFSRLKEYGYINPDDGDQDIDEHDPKPKDSGSRKPQIDQRSEFESRNRAKDSQA